MVYNDYINRESSRFSYSFCDIGYDNSFQCSFPPDSSYEVNVYPVQIEFYLLSIIHPHASLFLSSYYFNLSTKHWKHEKNEGE